MHLLQKCISSSTPHDADVAGIDEDNLNSAWSSVSEISVSWGIFVVDDDDDIIDAAAVSSVNPLDECIAVWKFLLTPSCILIRLFHEGKHTPTQNTRA